MENWYLVLGLTLAMLVGYSLGHKANETIIATAEASSIVSPKAQLAIPSKERRPLLLEVSEMDVLDIVEKTKPELVIAPSCSSKALPIPKLVEPSDESVQAFEEVMSVVNDQLYSERWRHDELAMIIEKAPDLLLEQRQVIMEAFVSAINSGEISPRMPPPL